MLNNKLILLILFKNIMEKRILLIYTIIIKVRSKRFFFMYLIAIKSNFSNSYPSDLKSNHIFDQRNHSCLDCILLDIRSISLTFSTYFLILQNWICPPYDHFLCWNCLVSYYAHNCNTHKFYGLKEIYIY